MSNMGNTVRDVNALRLEKEAALVSLGKMMHKLARDGKISDDVCNRLTERISHIDAELCIAEGGRVPGQGEGICPNCNAAIVSAMAAFCGACGTNIAEYYARNTANCGNCGQLTAYDGNYCTVCGVRR